LVQLDTVDDGANEKEEDNGKMEDVDCIHDIRIHEDLGHVCRICGMIVRRAESIIDYQWKKVRNFLKIQEAFVGLAHLAV
jgi:DNA repair and recombination RAD54-like protein